LVVLNPQDSTLSKYSPWVSHARSDTSPYVYANADRRRDAVTDGSNWRKEPAAALRGFANTLPPVSADSAFNAIKSARAM
jgi:hypothetical protein